MAILAAVLVASLFGSLHCAGMCGPLVVFAMGSTDVRSNRLRFFVQMAYHGGRLTTYALVGAMCGLLGAALDLGGTFVGLHRVAALLAGGMMVLVGVAAVLRYSGIRLPHLPAPPLLQGWVLWGQRAAMGLRPVSRALVIGLLTAFLPCGWLYAFAIIAAGTASVPLGAAVMVAFWAGTVPVLASLGVGVQTLTGTVGRRIPLITALLVAILGLYTIAGRMTIPAHALGKTRDNGRGSEPDGPDRIGHPSTTTMLPRGWPRVVTEDISRETAGDDSSQPVLCGPHCGLVVPKGLLENSQQEQFCCNGCRAVYAVIHGCRLERFYKLRESTDADPLPAKSTGRRYAEFDDAVFQDHYVRRTSEGLHSIELYLEGVHCSACVWLVEKLPRVVDGVIEARLEIRRSLVRISWEEDAVTLSQIAGALDSLGYPPHPAKDAKARELRRQEDHRFLIRIGVAGACAGNVMTLAFALYGGVFSGIEAQYSQFFRLASMVFGIIALAWPGNLFFRGAWAALRTRTAHLDLPIAIALLVGGLAGTINAVVGRGDIYFDSLTMLVFLLLVGRWIQRRQQRWANDAVELLFALTPTSARRVEGNDLCEVPIEAIVPGDLVEVRAGESMPTDGCVVEGDSSVDQSLLTGESRSIGVGPGDPIHAGTVNLGARMRVRVEAVGEKTRVGRLMRLVEECSQQRAPIVLFADRVAGWFVGGVVSLAIVTFLLWAWRDLSEAVDHSVALLIVTCPCALGLATPLAVSVALGRAAQKQILIKGGETLELLARPGRMLLDKTGTLTAGRTTVVAYWGDETVQPKVAALERHSAHPIARALVQAFGEETNDVSAVQVTDVHQVTGRGVTGMVGGQRIMTGSPEFLRLQDVQIPVAMTEGVQAAVTAEATPVLVAVDHRCVAAIALGDPIRPDAAKALNQVRSFGWEIGVLSGDHPAVVAAVAKQLGIPQESSFGGVTPEGKSEYIQQAMKEGRVVMVGDGVNDAAAFSAATVGIAVHGGAEASLAAADVYLNRPGLTSIVELLNAARRTLRTIRRSLGVSLCYNAVAASLAVAGWISPLLAAVLMPISSFTVLAAVLVSRTFGGRG